MVATQQRSYWKERVLNFYDQSMNLEFRDGLWANCPIEAIMADPQLGTIFYDDFTHIGVSGDTWTIVEDAGAAGTDKVTDAANGWYQHYADDGSDEDEAYLATAAGSWQLASNKPCWFEVSVAWTNPATTVGNFICGLYENAGDANSYQDAEGGPPADYDGVSFSKTSGTTVLAFETSIATDQVTQTLDAAFVSGTTYRLGFYWDGGTTVTPYLDGVAATAHTMAATGAAANAMAGGAKGTGTGECLFAADYIKIVQLR